MAQAKTKNVPNLKCSRCKLEKPADQFPGFNVGRPGYRCLDCSADERILTKYRSEISKDSIETSEEKLRRKQHLVDLFRQELEKHKARARV